MLKNKTFVIIGFILIILPLVLFISKVDAETVGNDWVDEENQDNIHMRTIGVDTYYDKYTNQWKLANHSISTSNGSYYSVRENQFEAYFHTNLTKDDVIIVKNDSTTVSFVPKSIYLQSNPQNATKIQAPVFSTTGNRASYKGIFGTDTVLNYTVSSSMLKEDLIFYSNPYPSAFNNDTFIFKQQFNFSDASMYINGALWDKSTPVITSSEEVEFIKDGVVVFRFIKPYAIDAKMNTMFLSYDFSSTDGIMNVKLSVPMSWLNNASYPITIDPTISSDYTSSKDSYVHNNYPVNNYGTSTQLNIYMNTIGVTAYALLFFPVNNLPSNTTSIINATLFVYEPGNGRSDSISVQKLLSSWNENDVTWNTAPTNGAEVNTFLINSVGWHSVSITSVVTEWWNGSLTNNGISLYATNPYDTNAINIYSREGTYPPYIQVWYKTFPSTPVLIAHSNYHNSGSTTVSWNSVSGNPNYRVKVGTSSGASNILNETVTGTSSSSFNIIPTNTYYWSVYAFDDGGSSGWATESSFTFANTIPTVPAISKPTNNSRHYNNSVNFTWSLSTDVDGDSISAYDFWLSTQPDFSNTVNRTNFINNWTGNIVTTDGVTYYGKVRSYDGYGYSSWSGIVQFTENTAPLVANITLSPSSPSVVDNLTISMNGTDAEGDTLTKYYRWYKNGVLNTSWNDTTILNATGNYTSGDQIYVKGFIGDGYENSSELQSNIVIIGSNNTAPTLSGITLTPATKKYNKNFTVSSSTNITDSESSQVRLEVYRKFDNGSKQYLSNSSWFTPPNNASVEVTNPWSTGGAHTVYAVAEDSGNVTGQNNLTSSEVYATFTTDTTSPTVDDSGVSPSAVTTGSSVTITITANGRGANITSANVTVTRPDYTSVTLAMTCSYWSGDSSNCTRSYTANSGTGTYTIDSFGLEDDSNVSAVVTSSLTFTATAASSGSSGGGGGGGGNEYVPAPTVTPADNTSIIPFLKLKNITSGATEPQLQEISKCLTESLVLNNACSDFNYGVVIEPMNWWTASGAFISPLLIILAIMLKTGKGRNLVPDAVLYFLITVFIVAVLVSVGVNMYIVNYIAESPKYFYTFLSFGLWSSMVTVVGDYYGYRKYQKTILVWK